MICQHSTAFRIVKFTKKIHFSESAELVTTVSFAFIGIMAEIFGAIEV